MREQSEDEMIGWSWEAYVQQGCPSACTEAAHSRTTTPHRPHLSRQAGSSTACLLPPASGRKASCLQDKLKCFRMLIRTSCCFKAQIISSRSKGLVHERR